MVDSTRKAVVLNFEDTAFTILKPISQEYQYDVFVITENAYGEIHGELKRISDAMLMFNMSEEQFDKILNQL
jgi:hypothetical protein